MKLLLVLWFALIAAYCYGTESASAQIGWTVPQVIEAYGKHASVVWHREKVSYAQYYTPFWILGLYFNGDISKVSGAIVTKAEFKTISIAEGGGFHPVAISDIQYLMEQNSMGHAWEGFVTKHGPGEEYVTAAPLDWNASGYYAGVSFQYFPATSPNSDAPPR